MKTGALVIVLSAALLLIVSALDLAQAHDFYAGSCCSNRDCYPVEEGEITPAIDGWRVEATGEVIPYSSNKVKMTPSEAAKPYHRCSLGGRISARTLCVYVPSHGS
jgi:hypothetical protein